MRHRSRLLLLVSAVSLFAVGHAQTLKPGGKAPEIKSAEWVKGKAFTKFADNEFTVVEFWATWCGPCVDAIPHLTELAKKHQGKIAFYGMNVWESPEPGKDVAPQIKKFVADMGAKMDYNIGRDTADGFMAKNWMEAAKQNGIPATFLVDKQGTVLWIGHPMSLDSVLQEALDGKLDVKKSLEKFEKEMAETKKMEQASDELAKAQELFEEGKKAEALKKVDAIDDAGNGNIYMMKMDAKVSMVFEDFAAVSKFVDDLVKKGPVTDKHNDHRPFLLVAMIPPKVTENHHAKYKELAARCIEEGIKLAPDEAFVYYSATTSWLHLKERAKAKATCEKGIEVLNKSSQKDNEQFKKIFEDLRKQVSG